MRLSAASLSSSLLWRLAACLLIAVSALIALPSHAQEPAPPAAPAEPTLETLRAEFDKLPKTLEGNATLDIDEVLAPARTVGEQAQRFVDARTGQLADLNAQLGELGEPPAAGAPPEDADITRRRAALLRERNALDADIRLARLLAVDAQQRAKELLGQRRAQLEAELTLRGPSPLGSTFWTQLSASWPEDRARLAALARELDTSLRPAAEPPHRTQFVLRMALAVGLFIGLNLALERLLVGLAQRLLPAGRLRRSLLVGATVLANMLVFFVAAMVVNSAFRAAGDLSATARSFVDGTLTVVLVMTLVASLGRALLSNARPSWRLPPMDDALARRLAPFPWCMAAAVGLVSLPQLLTALTEPGMPLLLAVNSFNALVLTAAILLMLTRLRGPRARRRAAADDDTQAKAGEPAERPARSFQPPMWLGLLLGVVSVALVAVWAMVALGYATLADVTAAQLTWALIVGMAFYVLFKLADDLCVALLSSRGTLAQLVQRTLGLAPRVLDQLSTVLSLLLRVALFVLMLVALRAPFGTGPTEVFERANALGDGLTIGEFQLVPSSILGAVAVLAGGLVLLRLGKRWLTERFLPHTAIEPEMRGSIVTLLGYAGGVVVVASALSALGIGINRIAWIASALSVGIGFGLQAIVQNFISGLILLAERPVKVGDWVMLDTVEGDVKRINVRATEIQLGDRSTLIVPNSEFITKAVRNMTLANAEGRVLIRLPMPLDTDAQRVRELMLAACAGHPGVLASPAPSLTLEGVENGMLVFQAIAYVSGPRVAAGVKSELLFAMLDAFRSAGLPMARPTMVMSAAPPSALAPAPLASM